MKSSKFGVHEITDMRELINFKVACVTEAKDRLSKVENPELKGLVEESITQGNQCINEMSGILKSAISEIH